MQTKTSKLLIFYQQIISTFLIFLFNKYMKFSKKRISFLKLLTILGVLFDNQMLI